VNGIEGDRYRGRQMEIVDERVKDRLTNRHTHREYREIERKSILE